MKGKFKILQEESQKVALDESERQALRDSLMSYMEKTPVREPVIAQSEAESKRRNITKTSGTLGILILLLLAGIGVSYAAEQTVPGDNLYPVKVSVTEKVRGTLCFSEKRRAEHEAALIDRRLQEAEKLHDQSRLSANVRQAMADDFSHHVQTLSQHVQMLTQNNNRDAAEKITAKLESSLSTHADVVHILTVNASEN
ncbi:hypothetical protein KW782_02215 [Candidatus Parcubacteria bacterium]|nr:hypothetical protein [Candidatus Parcubacteria bacterium]